MIHPSTVSAPILQKYPPTTIFVRQTRMPLTDRRVNVIGRFFGPVNRFRFYFRQSSVCDAKRRPERLQWKSNRVYITRLFFLSKRKTIKMSLDRYLSARVPREGHGERERARFYFLIWALVV